jgi:dipeptidyl aminopeptidase/acylaminoacyl peptidase
MKKIFSTIRFAALLTLMSAAAQAAPRSVQVAQLKATALYPLPTLVPLDTIDAQRKPFGALSYLRNAVDFDVLKAEHGTLSADSSGAFVLPAAAEKYALQLLTFHVDADRYCRATLSIAATDLLELYVDNQLKETNKKQVAQLKEAKEISATLNLEPRRYTVVIKRLANAADSVQPSIKIALKLNAADTLAQLAFTADFSSPRRITTGDILEGKRISSCSISPSGKYYFYYVSEVELGGKTTSIYVVKELPSNKTVYRLSSANAPRWLQHADALCYDRAADPGSNIYTLDMATLSEQKVAENLSYSSFYFSPNGRYIALKVQDKIEADKGDLRRLLSPNQRGSDFLSRENIGIYSVADKTTQLLSYGRTSLSMADISANSRYLLLMLDHEDFAIGRPFRRILLCRYDVEAQQLDTLAEDSFMIGAKFSPDAQQIAIMGGGECFGGAGLKVAAGQVPNRYDHQLFILRVADKSVRAVSKNFDPSIAGYSWHSDGKIYLVAADKDCQNVFSFDPKTERYSQLAIPEEVVRQFSLADAAEAQTALVLGQSTSNSNRLYAYNLKTNKCTLLEDPYRERLAELGLGKVEAWDFQSPDGTTIQGRYHLPHNFDATKKYPLVVYYYGGTSPSQRIFETTYPAHVYAAQGYVVYVVNPSGCTGYGQEFSARHVNAWGIKTADEIILGTQLFFRSHAFVDSTKIGCVGASYGGFMTQYLQTRTKLFAAAVSHAGISNVTSYWGEGYWGWSYSLTASAHSYPWNNPKLYTEQSPLFAADKITTPLLLLHGGDDTNVPIGESIQMYNALKLLNKTVELVIVDGENHVIRTYQKRIDFNKRIFAWFAKWLKGQPEWWEAMYPER